MSEQHEAQQQIGRRLNELADRYSGSLKRSGGENKMRADVRREIEELGYSAEAFQPAVAIARTKRKAEADHYMTSLEFFVEQLLGRQQELFPEDFERMQKREERKAAKEGIQGNAGAPDSDSNPRSNPNNGGAKPHIPVENPIDEQAEGEAALAANLQKSQSAQAKAKRELAGVH